MFASREEVDTRVQIPLSLLPSAQVGHGTGRVLLRCSPRCLTAARCRERSPSARVPSTQCGMSIAPHQMPLKPWLHRLYPQALPVPAHRPRHWSLLYGVHQCCNFLSLNSWTDSQLVALYLDSGNLYSMEGEPGAVGSSRYQLLAKVIDICHLVHLGIIYLSRDLRHGLVRSLLCFHDKNIFLRCVIEYILRCQFQSQTWQTEKLVCVWLLPFKMSGKDILRSRHTTSRVHQVTG